MKFIRLFCAMLCTALLLAACGGGSNADSAQSGKSAQTAVATQAGAGLAGMPANGWYWNPVQSGTGFMFEMQRDKGFVGFFLYDDLGNPVWYVSQGVVTQVNGAYQFKGMLQSYENGQAADSGTYRSPVARDVGEVLIVFSGSGKDTKTTVTLPGGRVLNAERFPIVPGGLDMAPNPAAPETGWYWNPEQGGRGWAIEVQGNTVFMAMFHYGTSGPAWHIVSGDLSNGKLLTDFQRYSGGQTITGNYRSPPSSVSAGQYELRFPEGCVGTAALQGMTTELIQRFNFGLVTPSQLCTAHGPAAATFQAPADGKVPWNLATPLQVTLRNDAGSVLPQTSLSCSAADSGVITVASDCSSIKASRLGSFPVKVSSGDTSAILMVKVIPQRFWSGLRGTSLAGSLVVMPNGGPWSWGNNYLGVLGRGVPASVLRIAETPAPVVATTGRTAMLGAVQASLGAGNAMALTENGTVWTWGGNQTFATSGRNDVIDGTLLPLAVRNPQESADLSHVVQVEVGTTNAVALLDDGQVVAWGTCTGSGDGFIHSTPVYVRNVAGTGNLGNIVAVAAGKNSYMALSADGRVYYWGYQRAAFTSNECAVQPSLVKRVDGSDLSDIVGISLGGDYALALSRDSSVWEWVPGGIIMDGKLEVPASRLAKQVQDPNSGGIWAGLTMVAAGATQALAMDKNGGVHSWRGGASGRMIAGSLVKPKQVAQGTDKAPLSNVVSIAAGSLHYQALLKDGSLMTWGYNEYGQMGYGVTTDPTYYAPAAFQVLISSTEKVKFGSVAVYPNLTRARQP
ncbi:hypothetical protein IGB42_02836 [Andreprevotia sp. IGB-42]|uniref:RCC1 domain-containing protein n=1 Tax=Andreprevotia sp. IGB-42 TaxID=2497473 RepID=UPI00135B6349|nr:hypothetical protein [Andreprevotia sp. IGB-42]KAF0812547.1 hypothetical protein IGB42_02836 [Andreprevotia sp. IGB-42]